MAAHARLGPSNARWPSCPGSVREEARYPDMPGEAAIDGTGSHELLEMCLKNGVSADAYDGQIISINHPDMPGGWMVQPDRIARVNMCLDYVDRRVNELKEQFKGATITVAAESRSDPGGMFGRDDWWGTVDITITARDPHLGECLFIEIIDYKDGRGWVHVPGNTQLLSYLTGKIRSYVASGPDLVRPFNPGKVQACRITIVQPKTNPVVRYEEVTPVEALAEAERLSIAAIATDNPDAPLIPDDKGGKGYCRWCKHKPYCNAESEKSLAVVNNMSTNVIQTDGQSIFEYIGTAVADPSKLEDDKLAELADAEAGIQAAFDKVKKEIERRIDAGINMKQFGYAMVPGNGTRKYNADKETIIKALKGRRMKQADIFPPVLITPAALMKCKALSDEQKTRFEKEFISMISSDKLSLRQVSREEVQEEIMLKEIREKMFTTIENDLLKNVAQSETPVLLSTDPTFTEEVSFF